MKTKINDIIKFALTITEYPSQNLNKYLYQVGFCRNDEEMGGYSLIITGNHIPAFLYDLENCIKYLIKRDFQEIVDYEIFDLETENSKFQTAKVKIKEI